MLMYSICLKKQKVFVLDLFFECAPFWFAIVCFNLDLNCYNFTMTCFKGLMFYPFSDFFFLVPDSSKGASQGTLSKKNFNKVFFFCKNYISPENGIFGPLLTASYKNSQYCLSAKNGSLWALHVLKERSQARGAVSEPSEPFATPQRDDFQKGTSPSTLSDRKARN